ncbi:MAG TPA: DUF4974 domain-containing protein [Flavobacteriaceae bacterium]|jgi:ferric-dicitrate binding protein FerR (iron transport regulator)|nr:DUF4974 domain-containing protein [Flavobacteriaceae bacterium]|tara:strand:- start:27891 stop:28793 length:903 start_codon:yes stop_codon:yes gene_type:complete
MEKDYLIQKWLNNDLTKEEQQAFEQLDDVALNKAIIDNASHFKASQFHAPASFEALEKRIEAKQHPVRKISWKRTLLQVASVIVLGFAVYYGFFFNQSTTVQTLAAEKTTFSLPDTSEVTLNAASEITYNEANWSKKRSLQLTGEAYFKVAKGKKFDVETSAGTVSVLGTQFNVKQRNSYFEVSCFEGRVQVTADTIIRTLLAGDSFRIHNGMVESLKIDNSNPSWTNNKSLFNAAPLHQVLNELERQYAITVTYEGAKKNDLFSGGFTHDDLESALKAITTPLDLRYNIESDNIVILSD